MNILQIQTGSTTNVFGFVYFYVKFTDSQGPVLIHYRPNLGINVLANTELKGGRKQEHAAPFF